MTIQDKMVVDTVGNFMAKVHDMESGSVSLLANNVRSKIQDNLGEHTFGNARAKVQGNESGVVSVPADNVKTKIQDRGLDEVMNNDFNSKVEPAICRWCGEPAGKGTLRVGFNGGCKECERVRKEAGELG